MRDAQQNIYIQRINHTIDYIAAHIDQDLPLTTLADVAGFSQFHFHRIFKCMVGETVNQFVWRLRVERAARLLRSEPGMTVSDAAIAVGFGSLAGFSRAFKTRFGVSPTHWDRDSQLQDLTFRELDAFDVYHITELAAFEEEFEVQFRPMSAQRIAYIRIHNAYSDDGRIRSAYHQLLDWYQQRGGHLSDTVLYGMSQDDPDITPFEQCRFDWCLQVPANWQGDDSVSVRDFPACQLAYIAMNGEDIHTEDRLLQYFWRYWLPRSQYQPANLHGMEIYCRFPHEAGWWETLYIDCAIPVTRL